MTGGAAAKIACFVGISLLVVGFSSMQPVVEEKPTPLIIDYPAYFGGRVPVPADNPTTVEGVQLGRMLFYEAALSANGKVSCATCHQQIHAFTDGKRFSSGVDGSLLARNTMSLANLLLVRQFFWDGRTKGLEAQAVEPLTHPHEMGQSLEESIRKLMDKGVYRPYFRAAFGVDQVSGAYMLKALAQFQRTLVSSNSRYDRYLQGKYSRTLSEHRGMALFFNAPSDRLRGVGCAHCHGGPQTYQEVFHNNGLDGFSIDSGRMSVTGNAYDQNRFRVATLRNIALTAPYMHDGRFQTLEEVIDHYNEGVTDHSTLSPFLKGQDGKALRLGLSAVEKKDLLSFLQMLTDSVFIHDKRHANPFRNK